MDGFCGASDFWDSELTWNNNSWPQFTDCFQNTVLQWVPCGWLWITAPFYIYSLLGSKKKPQPVKYLFCTKQFCSLALLLVFILDIVEAFNKTKSHDFDADLLAPVLWIITLILHSGLVLMERSRDVVRSIAMFMFWTLTGICMLIPFYSSFMVQMYDTNLFKFALLCIKYCAIVVLIFLNCFSEYYGEKPKGHNPEISASVLSWFTFSFLDRIVFQGFRSPLLSNDIYEMLPADTADMVITKFLRFWDQEQKNKLSHHVKDQQTNNSASSSVEETANEKTPLLVSWKKSSAAVSVHDSKHKQEAPGGDHDHTSVEIQEPERVKVSFFKALIKCYWLEGISSNWGMLAYVITSIVSPFVLGWLIDFTSNTSEWTWHGYIYTLAFIAAKVLYVAFGVMSKYLTNRLALRLNTTGIGTVFRKALTVSGEARKESTLGEIVNLMSVDSGHVEMMVNYSYWMWMSFIFLVLGIYLLYTIIGIALLSGMAVVIIMFAVNFWVMHKMREYQDQIMVIKDERVKIVNEALNGIKVIKLYGWEPMFIEKITEVRERELKILFKYAILDGVEAFAWLAAMFWMMHLMLVTFVMIDDSHYLDANTSFRTMNYIDVISLAINIMPIIVKDWIKAANSVGRLNKFLNQQDLNLDNLYRDRSDKLALRVVHADFAWESSGPATLRDLTLSVEPGQFVAIVGTVGAGKSSLLSAVLGEMHKRTGYFNLNSSVAYVPQQAWIQNNTVKENILFGQGFNEDHYNEVVRACALQPDLDMMPAGDSTEIGEKGINMSGGQKQRVSLARAVYSGADIYLLDDPLSAVDSHVGKHIFDQVLSKDGILNGKTRIMVTHGVQWLPHVDYIVVMNHGTVSEAGTFEKLMDHNGAFAQFLTQYLRQEESTVSVKGADVILDEEVKADILRRLVSVTSDSESAFSHETSGRHGLASKDGVSTLLHELSTADRKLSQSHSVSRHRGVSEMSSRLEVSQRSEIRENVQVAPVLEDGVDKSRLTTEEEAALGKVKWSMYWELVKGVGVGHTCLIIFLFACYHIAYNFTNIWLTNWNDDVGLSNFTSWPEDSKARKDRNVYYIGIYTALGLAQTIFVIGYSIDLQIQHVRTARKLHAELLNCIMRAPMSFFDTTPIGRILNRFSQDIEVLDNDIFIEAEISMDKAFRCLGTVIIISYTMPIFIAVVVPVIVILYVIQQFYIRTSCQLRRIASNNKSPVYAHFSETLSGVSVIRAYEAQDRFVADSQRKVDNFQKANYVARAVNKWLEIRLEVLSYIIVAAAGIFAVISRGDLSAGLVGLAVTYALRVSGEMNIFTIVFGDLETHIVSVERIREFSVVSSEASWTSSVDDQVVREEWPSRGQIEFKSYSTRYRDGLDLVLKGLDCTIQGGEKVGIVGRTGAGKSSMVLSLFRLIEATGGKVVIDGIDVSSIGLHALRRKLTILPQDPVLFAGSLRMNLDPFFEKSDQELWAALEHSHLKTFVDSLPNKLDHEVGEGGENLSMGQRQLVCLARTLLRKTKILILDEATAAVDMETDDLIQKTIRTEFSGCTILTIAHRLNTVMDYDRILVLDGGQVAEFDSPNNLLANTDSIFYSMASQAGLVSHE
jgi:ABC-type multidrug transport system fused ATPase/permease subunit